MTGTAGSPAGLGSRAVARIVDVVLVMLPAWLVLAPLLLAVLPDARATTLVTAVLAWVVVVAYEAWFTTVTGQTMGKRAVGIRVVSVGTDHPPPAGASVTRATVPVLFGVATLGIGWLLPYLWAIWDRDHRGLHDRLAGTEVLQVLS